MSGDGTESDGPKIEVPASVYERFEEERQKTKTVHAPAMDQATFLSALLDTNQAVREGYYDRSVDTETERGESAMTKEQLNSMSDLEVHQALTDLSFVPIFIGSIVYAVAAYIVMRPGTVLAIFDGIEYVLGAIGFVLIMGSIAIRVWAERGGPERRRRVLRRIIEV